MIGIKAGAVEEVVDLVAGGGDLVGVAMELGGVASVPVGGGWLVESGEIEFLGQLLDAVFELGPVDGGTWGANGG